MPLLRILQIFSFIKYKSLRFAILLSTIISWTIVPLLTNAHGPNSVPNPQPQVPLPRPTAQPQAQAQTQHQFRPPLFRPPWTGSNLDCWCTARKEQGKRTPCTAKYFTCRFGIVWKTPNPFPFLIWTGYENFGITPKALYCLKDITCENWSATKHHDHRVTAPGWAYRRSRSYQECIR